MIAPPGLHYALVRMLLGLYLVIHFAGLTPYAADIYGPGGIFRDAIATPFPNLLTLDTWVDPALFMAVFAVLSLTYALGLYRRPVALLLWYGWACLINRLPFLAIPSEGYIGWLLLASVVIPAGEPLALARREPQWRLPPLVFAAAWLVQGLSYTVSGLEKLWSPSWRDGSALAIVLESAIARDWWPTAPLLALPPVVLQIATWGVLGFEASFALLCLTSEARKYAWAAMVGLHVVVLVLLDLTTVSCAMLIFHAFTFDVRWVPVRSRPPAAGSVDASAAAAVGLPAPPADPGPMGSARAPDAVVVGAGPNGLAAAITLALAGRSVLVFEAAGRVGGGARSAALTLPGFLHDVCSAIHPLAVGSPLFRSLPLAGHGLQFVDPPSPLAHPLDDGTAVLLERSVGDTAAGLGPDGSAYQRLIGPLVDRWAVIAPDILGPLRVPRHPIALARFGLNALRSADAVAHSRFRGERARAVFAGLAAHSMLPLGTRPSAGVGLVLAILGHVCGWPVARGGSQRIADALASYLGSLGGEIRTGRRVESLEELPAARIMLVEVTPRQLLRMAGGRLPASYHRRLARYRYGPGVFKVDWALDGPIPWQAAGCSRAATVHLGGHLEEIAAAEAMVANGQHPDRPFVILAQPTLIDPTRAPRGKHTAWAYCHVPNGSDVNMTGRIEQQVERFAPGFRDRILARHVMKPADLERYNENYVGGDINGGLQDLRQLFSRPIARLVPYATPIRGLYLCSASTPPGGGVHGMCGYWAARFALKSTRK